MAGKNTAVFGIYPNRTSVDSAVDALKAASVERGFSLDAANNGTETVIPLPVANADVQEVAQLRGGISFPARR